MERRCFSLKINASSFVSAAGRKKKKIIQRVFKRRSSSFFRSVATVSFYLTV